MIPRKVLVVGDGPLVDGLAAGLRQREHAVVVERADDSSREAVGALVDAAEHALGGLDTVVWAQHAPAEPAPVVDQPLDAWVRTCEEPMTVAFHLTQAAHRPLAASGRGRFVYVIPTIGMAGAAQFAGAAAAAESVRSLTKGVAKQWGPDGITVNCLAVSPEQVYPGPVGASLAEQVSLAAAALGGPGDAAADIAPVVSLLGDDDAHFVTGSTLVADGGVWLTL